MSFEAQRRGRFVLLLADFCNRFSSTCVCVPAGFLSLCAWPHETRKAPACLEFIFDQQGIIKVVS